MKAFSKISNHSFFKALDKGRQRGTRGTGILLPALGEQPSRGRHANQREGECRGMWAPSICIRVSANPALSASVSVSAWPQRVWSNLLKWKFPVKDRGKKTVEKASQRKCFQIRRSSGALWESPCREKCKLLTEWGKEAALKTSVS